MTIVLPLPSIRLFRRDRIALPVSASRLPVGSSAKDERRVVGESAGNGNALLLAA